MTKQLRNLLFLFLLTNRCRVLSLHIARKTHLMQCCSKCSNMPVKPLPASVFLFNESATISFFTKGYRKMQKFGRNND